MNSDEAMVVNEFKDDMVMYIKNVLLALPAIIPQSTEDQQIFTEGRVALEELLNNLEKSENIRDIAQCLDVDKIIADYDLETIKDLKMKVSDSSRSALQHLKEVSESMLE